MDYLDGSNVVTRNFLEVEEGDRREVKVRERDVMMEAEVGVIQCEKDPQSHGWL